MSRLSYPQRLGIILTGILMLLAVIAIALMPAPKADIPVYKAAPADTATQPASTRKAKPSAKAPQRRPTPPPTPRSPLDETF